MQINSEQQYFVFNTGTHTSCHSFQSVYDHTRNIAAILKAPDLAPTVQEFGTLAGYQKYLRAIDVWANSSSVNSTYFDPDTPLEVQTVLENCRKSGRLIRIAYGDPKTGKTWFEENDVIGHIGRSCGKLKVPLLVSQNETGGGKILSANVICIMNVITNKILYKSSKFSDPHIDVIENTSHKKLPWETWAEGKLIARFNNQLLALEWRSFMACEISATRDHLKLIMQNAKFC